jgi:broad specificity phosphatase PhoE
MLILIRHAMPAFGPDVPAQDWLLSDDGQARAARLAAQLPEGAHLVASVEPKAWQTLEPAGTVARDPRFNEVFRAEPWEDDHRALRRAYVDGTDHAEWEPRVAVVRRFGAGIAHHRRVAGPRPLVVATHGMAMTLWLTAQGCLTDPGAFWADLEFPDALVIDLGTAKVRRLARSLH